MFVTAEVFQLPIGSLKEVSANNRDILVTIPRSQSAMSPYLEIRPGPSTSCCHRRTASRSSVSFWKAWQHVSRQWQELAVSNASSRFNAMALPQFYLAVAILTYIYIKKQGLTAGTAQSGTEQHQSRKLRMGKTDSGHFHGPLFPSGFKGDLNF